MKFPDIEYFILCYKVLRNFMLWAAYYFLGDLEN